MLARAIYRLPNYLFLDEPTANLDVANSLMITRLIAGMGCTRIAVTHDLEFARAADRLYELRAARLIECDWDELASVEPRDRDTRETPKSRSSSL
jgi:ABC-type lipoprotein export system ATPase subunit